MVFDEILRCPVSGARLKRRGEHYYSPAAGTEYRSEGGIVNFLTPSAGHFRSVEEKFWDYTYGREGERSAASRSAEFHHHFRAPLVNLPSGAVILEVACGNRADALEVAQQGKEVVETDISRQALELARSLARRMGVSEKVRFVQAEAEHLPFADSSFDGVLVAAAFHHLKDPLAGLMELRRVTKSGGYIVLGVEPNAWPYKTVYRLLGPLKRYIRRKRGRGIDSIADDSTQGFTKRQLESIFQKARIEVLEIRPVKFISEFYDSYVRLKERLQKKPVKPHDKLADILISLDQTLLAWPLLKHLGWHWNVISRVRK